MPWFFSSISTTKGMHGRHRALLAVPAAIAVVAWSPRRQTPLAGKVANISSLKGAAAQKFAARLVAAGLAKKVKAKPGAHIWRCDDVTRQAYALKLTPAGLKTIRVEKTEVLGTAIETSPTPAGEGLRKTKVHDVGAGNVALPAAITAPREGSKLAEVIGLRWCARSVIKLNCRAEGAAMGGGEKSAFHRLPSGWQFTNPGGPCFQR